MTYTIEFQHSSSPLFKFALQEAQKQPSFKEFNKSYSATYTKRQFEAMHKLLEYLKGIRNKRVFVDDQEMPWDEVFHYLPCYRLRQKAYNPTEYCTGDFRQYPAFNPWGCVQVLMPLSNDTEWLFYGKFDADGTFIFDKTKIEHCLKTNTYQFRFCPALNMNFILRILAAFPETVNPKINRDWDYNEIFDRHAVIGMEISCGSREKKFVAGVKPSSPIAIKNIYQKILKKIK